VAKQTIIFQITNIHQNTIMLQNIINIMQKIILKEIIINLIKIMSRKEVKRAIIHNFLEVAVKLQVVVQSDLEQGKMVMPGISDIK
jgi:hypothetical protein